MQQVYKISPAELPEIACEYGEFLSLRDAERWARAYSVTTPCALWAIWDSRLMYPYALVFAGHIFDERRN